MAISWTYDEREDGFYIKQRERSINHIMEDNVFLPRKELLKMLKEVERANGKKPDPDETRAE
jgi:hypothetical protein